MEQNEAKPAINPAPNPEAKTQTHPWMDTSKTALQRAKELVAAMSLEQKVDQLGGAMETINPYTLTIEDGANLRVWRHVAPIAELGIPRFNITNGPVGVGMGDGTPSPPATALPATLGLAASFDTELAYRYGALAGKEARTLGQHLLEAPGMCLARIGNGGRNFEYLSEDPYLSGAMAVAITRGIQDQGVLAEAKHYVVNDEEKERFRYDVAIDETALRELYLLPFEMCVKDGEVACIMGSYQRIRGTYGCENYYTLTKVLREDWGFTGYVQSDFWAVRSCAQSLNAGLDHEMPDHNWMNLENITHALDQQILEMATIDRALVRRYTQMFKHGLFDTQYEAGPIDAVSNGRFAREAAGQVICLLKNEPVADQGASTGEVAGRDLENKKPLLPLDPNTVGHILIVGLDQFANHICNCGGGSSQVIPLYEVPPAQGLRDVLAEMGAPEASSVEVFTVAQDLTNLTQASAAAAKADTVIIMAGLITTEGRDQESLELPGRQAEMISALGPVNPRTVLVLKDGDPVLMPFVDDVPAILECFNQGQEDGHAVADVLFGRVNPGAKLPVSYPRRAEDTCVYGDPSRYPGVDEGAGYPVMRYSEGLNMGYRWHQSEQIEPLFPFGFGLSYTTFALSDLRLELDGVKGGVEPGKVPLGSAPATTAECTGQECAGTVRVKVKVTNTGQVSGTEVVQVYAALPLPGQPPLRLVGFAKVKVLPGDSVIAEVTLDIAGSSHPLGVWSKDREAFVTKPGEYVLKVGTSSVDLPLSAKVKVGD